MLPDDGLANVPKLVVLVIGALELDEDVKEVVFLIAEAVGLATEFTIS
ncbi:hypothetical protein [Paenibacillus sp. NEAU-GSW1]|nr:hypothetical protein [Paenibacillus sp. NEAU-GSW1]